METLSSSLLLVYGMGILYLLLVVVVTIGVLRFAKLIQSLEKQLIYRGAVLNGVIQLIVMAVEACALFSVNPFSRICNPTAFE